MTGRPDRNCRTLPNGQCVSAYDCFHGPGMSAYDVLTAIINDAHGANADPAKSRVQATTALQALTVAGYIVTLPQPASPEPAGTATATEVFYAQLGREQCLLGFHAFTPWTPPHETTGVSLTWCTRGCGFYQRSDHGA